VLICRISGLVGEVFIAPKDIVSLVFNSNIIEVDGLKLLDVVSRLVFGLFIPFMYMPNVLFVVLAFIP
jgi:hypothetical protein